MNQNIIQNLCVGLYRKLQKKNQKKISHLLLFHINEFGETYINSPLVYILDNTNT